MKIYSDNIYTRYGKKAATLVFDDKIVDYSDDRNVDIDAKDLLVIPGIIDTHNHGYGGHDLMLAKDEDKTKIIKGFLKAVASCGVTGCFLTADESYFKDIAKVAKSDHLGSNILGIHSEGPYLNRTGENGIKEEAPKVDIDHIKKMVKDADGLLKLMGIAPELPHADEAIAYLKSEGIKVAMAHTDIDYDGAIRAFSKGISVVTHTANVMTGIHHRHMGALGAALLSDDVDNELIADGLHVSNEMIEIMFRIKRNAYERFMLVSDNIALAGMPKGEYDLEGLFKVTIDDEGFIKTDTGRLFGSSMPIIKGMKNLYENLHIDIEDLIKMSSTNASRVYGLGRKGSIDIGNDSDLVVVDRDFNVIYTIVAGKVVYALDKR